jgi:hypothetical protein
LAGIARSFPSGFRLEPVFRHGRLVQLFAEDRPDFVLQLDVFGVARIGVIAAFMGQHALIYMGTTRGKKLVALVGQKKAVAIAVKNVAGRIRWSKLDAGLAGDLLAALRQR